MNEDREFIRENIVKKRGALHSTIIVIGSVALFGLALYGYSIFFN